VQRDDADGAHRANVVDIADPADTRVDDFRDLNSVDRRPDLPSGKGLVIAEGVLVAQRMLASRFTPHAFLGTDRRLTEMSADLAGVAAPFYRASAEVMAEIVGFHLNRGVLAAARRAPELGLAELLGGGPSSATRRDWVWMRWSSAPAAPTRCTAGRSGSRWGMPCWCPSPEQPAGPGI
jgi:hypothetical protein